MALLLWINLTVLATGIFFVVVTWQFLEFFSLTFMVNDDESDLLRDKVFSLQVNLFFQRITFEKFIMPFLDACISTEKVFP